MMLSTKVIGNARDATHYYSSQDNYYTKENDAKNNSYWWGKGASTLGLEGAIDKAVFEKLLKGQLPNGQQLGLKVDGQLKHRAGFDLTFSVPKSVSMVALMTEDKAVRNTIVQSILKATEHTLDEIEKTCAQARMTQNGNTAYIDTKNLTGALFLHDISREGDPQLHVHAVIMNMTERPDGRWRSLASQSGAYGKEVTHAVNGFIEQVRQHKRYFGTLFRAELAYRLKEEGFSLSVDKEKSTFEIEGISEKAKSLYSTRVQQIEQYMKTYGFTSAKAAAVANLKTRRNKNTINREALHDFWKAKGEMHNMNAFHEVASVIQGRTQTAHGQAALVSIASKEALHYAIEVLSETELKMSSMQLTNVALHHAFEDVSVNALQEAIKNLKQEGELVLVGKEGNDLFYTTKTLLAQETFLIKAAHQKDPVISSPKIKGYLEAQTHLNAEQKEAIKTAFFDAHPLITLDGPANTGKTFLIKPLIECARLQRQHVVLLTPSKAGTVELQKNIQDSSSRLEAFFNRLLDTKHYSTVSRFIQGESAHHLSSQTVVMVDNAHLLSTKDMHALVSHAIEKKSRLILLGDKRSLTPWQAGNPYKLMQEQGKTVSLSTRYGTFNSEAVLVDTLENNIKGALQKIEGSLFQAESQEACIQLIANHYASIEKMDVRKNTVVLMPTQAQCHKVNAAIHEALLKNQINQVSMTIQVLLPKPLKSAEYRLSKNYQKGQWVRFNEDYLSLSIKRGDYYQIKAINSTDNTVIFQNKTNPILWNPAKAGGVSQKVEVFEEAVRNIAVGETLLMRRGHLQKGLIKGEQFTVLSLHKNALIVQRENGKSLKLDFKDFAQRHMDYGYALTPHSAHDKKANFVLAYQNAYSRQSHQRQFYKLLSQAKLKASLYTENREALVHRLENQTGDKLSLMDYIVKDEKALYEASVNAHFSDNSIKAALTKIENQALAGKPLEEKAKEAVQQAISHLAEREAAFTDKALHEKALTSLLGEADGEAISKAVKEIVHEGTLIQGQEDYWTTREALSLERDIILLAKEGKGKLLPLIDEKTLTGYLQEASPKSEHANVLKAWLLSKNRVIILQGDAGTGKTTLLKYAQPIIESQHKTLLGLAPTHTAVKELRDRGIQAQTLDSFIQGYQSHAFMVPQGKLVIALDESSMVSNEKMKTLLSIVNHFDARLFMIGDSKQFASIEAGKPHHLLQGLSIQTLYLKAIERQKDPALLLAVKETYQGHFASAFRLIEKNIVEAGFEKVGNEFLDNPQKRYEKMVEDYFLLSFAERQKTLIITPGNEARIQLNHKIREVLKAKGELHGEGIMAAVLVSKSLTQAELSDIHHYKVTDVVRFNTALSQMTPKGSYFTVQDVNKESQVITLLSESGQKVAWQPSPTSKTRTKLMMEVYRKETREVKQGDILRWTRSDKGRGLLAFELASVERVAKDAFEVRMLRSTKEGVEKVGEPITLEAGKHMNQHWDYAQVVTSYGAQGKSIHRVFCHMESFSKNLTNQTAFLINLTRAVNHFALYTDSKEALLAKIERSINAKKSALETLGETPLSSKDNSQKQPFLKKGDLKKPTEALNTFHKDQSIKAMVEKLEKNTKTLVESLLGEPKMKSQTHYFYSYSDHFGGENQKAVGGSLSIAVSGNKQGLWHCFKTGAGGHILGLIQKKYNVNFKESLAIGESLLGFNNAFSLPQKSNFSPINSIKKEEPVIQKDEQNNKKKIAYARRLYRESQSLKDTLAERYLKEHRGVLLEKFPKDLRFHPGIYSSVNQASRPALLAIARNEKGEVQAVQATYLDEKTARKAECNVQKQTWGVLEGASVNLSFNKENSSFTFLAEGVETALSVLKSMPENSVKATLGKANFKHQKLNKFQKHIVLCLDNDGKVKEDNLVTKAITALAKGERQVWLAQPKEEKKDYNDLLKEQGIDAIKSSLREAISSNDFLNPNPKPKTFKENFPDISSLTQRKNLSQNSLSDNRQKHFIQKENTELRLNQAVLKVARQEKNLITQKSFSESGVPKVATSPSKQGYTKKIKPIKDIDREI